MTSIPLIADWFARRERASAGKNDAYHEAGHVVADLLVGMRATAVRLYAPGDGVRAGYTSSHRKSCERRLVKIGAVPMAAVKLAGITAEAQYARELTAEMIDGARNDLMRAKVIVAGFRNPDRALAQAQRIAALLVRKHWAAVEAVAEELWMHGELSGNDATSIARQHGAPIRRLARSRPQRRFAQQRKIA